MAQHRYPPSFDCLPPVPHLGNCANHFRNDETQIYLVDNTCTNVEGETASFDAGTGSISVGDNKYSLALDSSGSYVSESLATCKKRWWMGFWGAVSWNGRFGFENPQGCNEVSYSICYNPEEGCDDEELTGPCYVCRDECPPDCYDGECNDFGRCCKKCHEPFQNPSICSASCPIEPIHNSPVTTKYLSIVVTGTMTYSEGDSVSLTFASSVDKHSGVITATSNYDSSSTGNVAFMRDYLRTKMQDAANITCPFLYDAGDPDPACPGYTYEYTYETDPLSQCYFTNTSQTAHLNNRWNWNFSRNYSDFCAGAGVIFGSGSMTHSDTEIAVTENISGTPIASSGSYSLEFTVTLSDPYTSEDVNADLESLLNNWHFDEVREWFNGYVDWFRCPFITYDQVEGAVSPMAGLFQDPGWVDSHSGSYTGEIMGLPMPYGVLATPFYRSASYGPYFNNHHRNYKADVEDCIGFTPYFQPMERPTGSYINIERATERVPDIVAKCDICGDSFPPATKTATAFRQYGMPYQAGRLVMGKYAEIFLGTRPSVNWDRPFASGSHNDERTRNENSQDCSAGSFKDIEYSLTGSRYDITTCNSESGDFTKPCGDPVWTGLVTKSVDEFWNDEGRKNEFVDVLWNYDFRDYAEADRWNARVAYCTASFVSESLSPVSVIRPVTRELKTVTAVDQFLSYDPCRANIIVIQPASNSSSFSRYNAKVYELPTIDLDEQYGSYVQRKPVQVMTDPFWRPSLKPCSTGSIPEEFEGECAEIAWYEDDGSIHPFFRLGDAIIYTDGTLCQDNFEYEVNSECEHYTMFYPLRPWVEARTAPPEDECFEQGTKVLNAQARKLGCSDYISFTNANPGTSSANFPKLVCEYCAPPLPYTITRDDFDNINYVSPLPYVIEAGWIEQLQCACVIGGGVWAPVYSENVSCGAVFLDW